MSCQALLSGEAALRRLVVRGLAVALVAGSAPAPVAAQMLVGDGSVECGGPLVIASGDTLSRISERAYGDPLLYGILADANREALGGDPERLSVGMSITVPCVDVSGEVLTPDEAAEAAASLEAVVLAAGPLTAAELDTLFGPVALFPDQVLTPVLVAVTFPIDVVKAGRFVMGAAALTDEERADEAAGQPWDASVRALAAGFPDLVTRMSDHIDWTEQAGEAVVAQTDDALAAIQRLRATAQVNGYLVDNEAQKVEEVNGKIVIAPADPGVVYVPTYDSKVVYAAPLAAPPVYGYDHYYYDDNDWDDALVAGGIILGGAVILDEIFDDDDWDGWDGDNDIDWDGGDITIDRGDVNIDRDDITIGDGDRPRIGDGDRVSIGDSDRVQVDRGDLAVRRDGTRRPPAGRVSISNPASRDVARQKIEARDNFGVGPAILGTERPATSRAPASLSRETARSRPGQPGPAISRPKVKQTPAARAPTRSSAFQQPSRARPSASANRGRASMGRAGGGRGGGGGRRR
jgi:Protein of unknown function (DUF3300)